MKKLIETTLDANKAQDIETIDLRDQSIIADFMIIATGQSSRQVVALSQKIEEAMSKAGHSGAIRIEGTQKGDWVVVDTGDIIIHLFRPEVREFYAIEKMWGAPAHIMLAQPPEASRLAT
ncbi:MAG: ribosome silencing factor [Alphaproteobacteria bacterium]|nr:ribosome silencing factor [Alphaproteobacteria bacterium]